VDRRVHIRTADYLIVDVDWAPDSQRVVYQIQDREQTWLDLNLADVENGRSRKLLRETTKAWVNNNGDPVWLKDGSFLWFSERTGFKHLYRVAADGAVIQPVTNGRWDVRTLYGVNQDAGVLYFAATERSPIGTDIYRINLDGTGPHRLSQTDGTHRAIFNPTSRSSPTCGAKSPRRRRCASIAAPALKSARSTSIRFRHCATTSCPLRNSCR
jgi:dipeptidyl-peptidase-4